MPAFEFDPRAAKKLAAGQHIAYGHRPGLRLVATTTRRSWVYRYKTAEGLMKQLKLGEWPATPYEQAVRQWEAARGERAGGLDVRAARRASVGKQNEERKRVAARALQTCSWLVEQYLQDVIERNRKPKGAKETRRMLERAVSSVNAVPIRELTAAQAHALIAAIAKTAPRIAAMTRQELRAAWEYGLGRDVVDANPFAAKRLGGSFHAKKRGRVLSEREASALLRWMREPGAYSRTVADALELSLRTGLRSGEVLGLRTVDLAERSGVLWAEIPAQQMKSGEPHAVPIVGRALEIVRLRTPVSGGFLFPARAGDKAIDQKVLGVEVYAHSGRSNATVYAGRRVCPVSDWVPHDLRRTARTMLAELGCPFEVGESILAHALPGVAGVYVRAKLAPQKIEWVSKLAAHLDRLALQPGKLARKREGSTQASSA